MTARNTRWTRDPDHTYCRLCTIRLDHSAVPVATADPTICADCETRGVAHRVTERLVTIREAAEIIGVSYGHFFRKYRSRLAISGKAQTKNGTTYRFRLSDVQRVAAQVAAGD